MKLRLPIARLAALGFAVFLAAPVAVAAEPDACALVPDADAKAIFGDGFDREGGSPTSCSIDTMKDGFYNRYLYLTVDRFEPPPGMNIKMDYAKERLAESSRNEEQDGGKRVSCKVPGATHYACFDVASPAGSFKPDQRAALVMVGKGDTFVRITVFHDERPNLEVGTQLAAKIQERLP